MRLFINIGTNDLSDPGVTIGHLMDHYDKILSIVEEKLPGIEIYLMAYYPVNYEAATEEMKPCLKIRTNDRIREANAAVQKLAKTSCAVYRHQRSVKGRRGQFAGGIYNRGNAISRKK